ncbi:acyltransferase [Opitutus sp. GAS368]|jgi:carbonic anhydrase/acetyltransferase-like protein (isoleucine patch superfamily)|uniref:acyltransferase n=1 Tax=Opitutus sp. GAS368 TaxID=1882749 RepID=UPI00087CB22B|nr:acyltransferase [Opitutus sp. GAS368]SDS26926.1 Carbonic anhydrase or acetyltransferase, isoleucine patch superfamily [Opitutus sp. GAS368]
MKWDATRGLPPNPYNAQAWITGEPRIGQGTWIGAFTLIDGSGGLTIGSGCDISCGAQILTHSTVKRCVTARRHATIEHCASEIGDCVFIGANAVILMGAKIGHHSIVAAGAIVLEHMEVPPYSLVAGVPARVVRSIENEAQHWAAESSPP